MKLTALIVDDEADSRNVLRRLLQDFCPDMSICGESPDADTALEMIVRLQPQVIFLDIQMTGGSGFTLLKRFSQLPFEVIFVTSYNEYAIEAIRFSALDYLLKPVEVSDLKRSVDRLQRSIAGKQNHQQQIDNMIMHVESRGPEKKIALHHNDRVIFISLDNIACMEGEGNYTVIHTIALEKYTSSKNLGEYEEMLKSYPQFFRISKGCLANLNHVTGYSKGDGDSGMLFIAGGLGFQISRRKKKILLERLKTLIER